jgi:hypothetical protein
LKIEYISLCHHTRTKKDKTKLFKTAQSNIEEKLPLNALCDTSYIYPKSVPLPYHIQIKTNSDKLFRMVPKQDTGLEGTVTDELFQVFHIERPVLLEVSDVGRPVEPADFLCGLSEYLLKIEYIALWHHTRMIKDNNHNTNLFKTAQSNNGEKLPLSALTGPPATHPTCNTLSHHQIQNRGRQMLTNYSGFVTKTGKRTRGHII